MHLWRSPTATRNVSDVAPFIRTQLLQSSHNDLTVLKRDPSRPCVARTSRSFPRGTPSYAFSRPMKQANIGRTYSQDPSRMSFRLGSRSVVPLPGRNPVGPSSNTDLHLFSQHLGVDFAEDA
ncbi:UNVERIFIED_CONTAM: hypothetical protein PYX00_002613 [Menopon gallinae]|uniref:Uncharacterized protein n=1 Tax=Menopon gallinae TaxID=328185 RepID=A0AAW2HY56_9NEOP